MIYTCISICASILIILAAKHFALRLELFCAESKAGRDASLINSDSRIIWIDVARGIAILLVIAGHTLCLLPSSSHVEKLLDDIIFSFHVPLFFIISSYITKLSNDETQLVSKAEKSFKNLILPTLFVFLLMLLFSINENFNLSYIKIYTANMINSLVYSSAVNVNLMGMTLPRIGKIWFLVVLFCGKTLFDYLHLKVHVTRLFWIIIGCAIVGIVIGQVQWLPFSFDVTLAVMPFFLFGYKLKQYDFTKKRLTGLVFFSVVWSLSFMAAYILADYYHINDQFSLGDRRYTLFPLCYVTAVFGSMAIIYLSQILALSRLISLGLAFLGRHSLCLLCVHYMDSMYTNVYLRTDFFVYNSILRIAADVIICLFVLKIIDVIKSNSFARRFKAN